MPNYSHSLHRVILLAQSKARNVNTLRALNEFEEMTDITELDHLLARGDRLIATRAITFSDESDAANYNERLTLALAEEAYAYAVEAGSVPCLSRTERMERRGVSK